MRTILVLVLSAAACRADGVTPRESLLGDGAWMASGVPAVAVPLTVADDAPQVIRVSVPPGPSSASLVSFALGSLGVWHIARTSRKHLSLAPDWYQTSGPKQIGHAHVYDLEWSGILLDRPFELPIVAASRVDRVCEIARPVLESCVPALAGPRAPPF